MIDGDYPGFSPEGEPQPGGEDVDLPEEEQTLIQNPNFLNFSLGVCCARLALLESLDRSGEPPDLEQRRVDLFASLANGKTLTELSAQAGENLSQQVVSGIWHADPDAEIAASIFLGKPLTSAGVYKDTQGHLNLPEHLDLAWNRALTGEEIKAEDIIEGYNFGDYIKQPHYYKSAGQEREKDMKREEEEKIRQVRELAMEKLEEARKKNSR